MALSKLFAIVLIVAGTLGVVYGGFNYPSETHEAVVGPLSLSVQETEHVAVPLWAGIGAIVIGSALLLFGSRYRAEPILVADESRVSAELASARAEVIKAKSVNDKMQQGLDTLKQELLRNSGSRQ